MAGMGAFHGKWTPQPLLRFTPMPKTALVAGATGATSKRLLEALAADSDWSVIGLSRQPPAGSGRLSYVAADMSDPEACRRALKDCGAITHIFYTARAKHGETAIE